MTTNIIIVQFGKPSSEEESNAKLAEAAAAQMEESYKAAVELQTTEDLFVLGYWVCDQSHAFGRGQIRSPRECPVCQSRVFKWVPGPGLSESHSLQLEVTAKHSEKGFQDVN